MPVRDGERKGASGPPVASVVLAILALAATIVTWIASPPQPMRYGAALALLWLLPAVGWFRCLEGDVVERTVSAAGLAVVNTGLATLILYLVPGPFPEAAARLVYFALTLVPLVVSVWRKPAPDSPLSTGFLVALVAVLVVSAAVRFPNLGYSEFQGDEAVIMQRAAEALSGDDEELFLHQKGPVEILIPMSVWALSGTVAEWQMRLPFTLTGLLTVVVVVALAERWFGWRAGIFAGLLVGIAGFLVAFSRIVQYQNLVVMMGGLSLLWMSRYRRRRCLLQLVVAAVFMAFGLLSHYDAILMAPAAAALLLATFLEHPGEQKRRILDSLVAVSVGAVLLGLFYVPYIANPIFSRTFGYLTGGRLGEGFFHNSVWGVWRMSTFYNSLYYVAGLFLGVVAAALMRFGSAAAWLSFGVPFFFYTFVVDDPRTHVYTFYAGAAILAGAACSRIVSVVRRRRGAALVGVILAMWYALSAGYVVLAFVSHQVEYKRAWPESRHPLYPVPFADDELPPYGHFGFPYRAGWKAVEQLFATGKLEGTYASNEEPEITIWYVRSGSRTMCGQPDVYVVAEDVQDEIAIDWAEVERDYVLLAEILVGERPRIRIYVPRTRAGREPLRLYAGDYVADFDDGTTVAAYAVKDIPASLDSFTEVERDFDQVARLIGYQIEPERPEAGDQLRVTLFWKALSSPERNYQVFTHLVQGDEILGQDDGAPACAFAPTSLWEQGEIVRDERIIELQPNWPAGEAQLYVGMYDLLTFVRLPVEGSTDDRILLRQVEIPAEAD
ncbi:MAG: ArnT family glycosyltransferase [Anaerolineae bacterium]